MPSFGVAEATLVSLFVESALWGIHLTIFWRCVHQLLAARTSFKHHLNLLIVSCSMFFLCTLTLGLLLERNLHAFILYDGSKGPVGDLIKISNWNVVMRGVLFLVIVMLGDGMLMYRCFVIYGNSWWIISGPILLMMGNMIGGLATPIEEAMIQGNAALTVHRLNIWTNIGSVFALTNNLTTTGLIAYRLWRLSRLTTSARRMGMGAYRIKPVNHALRIIVESGALYTASTILLFATSLAKHNAVYVMAASVPQLVGICFDLIIIRVSQNRTLETEMSRGAGATFPLQFVTPGATITRGTTTMAPSTDPEVTVIKDVDDTM